MPKKKLSTCGTECSYFLVLSSLLEDGDIATFNNQVEMCYTNSTTSSDLIACANLSSANIADCAREVYKSLNCA